MMSNSPTSIPETMFAIHLTGHGGIDKLIYRDDVRTPCPGYDDVLIQITAAGVNNTDINTRIGWYSKSVNLDTSSGAKDGFDDFCEEDAGWAGVPLSFPRIQGADCSGFIVSVGEGVDPVRIGERVLVRSMMDDPINPSPFTCWTMGSECDGAFAQYTKVPSSEAFAIVTDWSDIELASIPCAYSTAENMLHRIGLGAERVVITGSSGGVGSAAVQLAKRRRAEVVAVSSASKKSAIKTIGADHVLNRGDDLVDALGPNSVDAVVDLVGGNNWPVLLELLKRGGRYITSGAIAGPIVGLDLRTLYLKDLSILGATYQDKVVFRNLISYIENDEIKPQIAATFPLASIGEAQKMFLSKDFVGKIVLTVPSVMTR